MTAKYYIRPRAEINPKSWQGPFDTTKLKELAGRKLFSKELHEYSEDRLNWISARQIWPTLFPKSVKTLLSTSQPIPIVTATAEQGSPSAASIGGQEPKETSPANEEAPEWYCSNDGTQQGPFTLSQLRSHVSNGRVQASDLVWCPQFAEQWVEAQSVPEVFSAGAAAPFDFAGVATQSKPAAGIPPLALASLILGVLGASLLPGVGSILAVILGHIALADFKRRQGPSKGRGFAIAGVALGYTMIGIIAIATVVYLAIT